MYKEHLLNIIENEKEFLLKGEEDFGEYFIHAMNCGELVSNFIKIPSPHSYGFMSFYTSVRKHHTLAILSAISRHHTQTQLNIRYMLESVCFAAFSLGNPNINNLIEVDNGLIKSYKKMETAFNRLNQNYPEENIKIKKDKDRINNQTAHSSFKYTHKVFEAKDVKQWSMNFFDIENIEHTKINLWHICDLTVLFLNLFFKIHQSSDCPVIKIRDNFEQKLQKLTIQNQALLLKGAQKK